MQTRRTDQTDQSNQPDRPKEVEGLSRREAEPQIAETGMSIEPWPEDAEPNSDGDTPTDEAPNPSPS